MPPTPGSRLGPYEITGSLGAGGMAEVYRARDTKLGREVALKVLSSAMAKDPGGLERFTREARAVAALNHPHIVTIFSTEEAEGVRFMTMELIEGRTLDRMIPKAGVSLPLFFDIATAVADALRAAHSKQITHRDLKPGNVMVSDDGRVKVLDFGISRTGEPETAGATVWEEETAQQLTRAGTILGTLPYMSPEQIEAKPLDHRSDIFSLGIVMYEMATGGRPFGGDSSAALLSAIMREHPKPAAELRPDLPMDVSRLVGKCLEKSPRDRLQTAHELLVELKALRRAWESGSLAASSTPSAVPSATSRADPFSIAVLPFADLSAAKDQEWFCDGVAEEILNALSQLEGLRVAARGSAFSFKGRNEDPHSIAQKLNVGAILEGSVRRAGDRVRITAQLSDAKQGVLLWSEQYDREMKDIFDVQDAIAKAIAERLRITLATSGRLVSKPTDNIEAYETYLRGRALLFKRGSGIPAALGLFQRVVAMDPGYALAWAGIADVHSMLGFYGMVRPSQARPHALQAAGRAIESDPGSAEAHASLGLVLLLYDADLEGAEREFEKALQLNPRDTQARCWYGFYYLSSACGRLQEGIAETRRAYDGDPLSSYAQTIFGLCLLALGRDGEALPVLRSALEADPGSFAARLSVGACLQTAGAVAEALPHFEEGARMSGHTGFAAGKLALALARSGRLEEAQAVSRSLKARATSQYVASINLAEAAFAAGDRDEAISLARRAVDEREPEMLMYVRHGQIYTWLHEQPEWPGLLRQIEDALKVRA